MSRKYKYCPSARYAAIVGVFLECFWFSGLIFGWSFFNQILHEQRFWPCPSLNESLVESLDSLAGHLLAPQHNASTATQLSRSLPESPTRHSTVDLLSAWQAVRDGRQMDDSMLRDLAQLTCCSNSSMLEKLCHRDESCPSSIRCLCPDMFPDNPVDCHQSVRTLEWLHHSGHVLFYVLLLPAGLFHDRFGTMKARSVGILSFAAATLVVSFSNQDRSSQILASLLLFAVSGAFVLLPSLPISNLFFKYKSTLVALYCAATECSAVVFFLIQETYRRGVKMQLSFMFLTAGALPVLVNTCAFLPTKWIKETDVDEQSGREESEDVEDKMIRVAIRTSFAIAASEGSLPNEADLIQMAERQTRRTKRRRISLLDTARVLKTELVSRRYLSHWLWVVLLHASGECLVHGLQESDSFIRESTPSAGYAPLSGLLFCPLVGMLMDLRMGPFDAGGRNFSLALLLVALGLAATISVALAAPALLQQHVAFVHVVVRSLTNTCLAAFLNAMVMKKYFGSLVGIVFASMGLVSLALFLLADMALHDGHHYLLGPALVLVLLDVAHPAWMLWAECRHVARRGSTQQDD